MGLIMQIAYAQTTPSPEMVAANELVKEKKWQEAEKAFAEIVKKEPEKCTCVVYVGFSQTFAGKMVRSDRGI